MKGRRFSTLPLRRAAAALCIVFIGASALALAATSPQELSEAAKRQAAAAAARAQAVKPAEVADTKRVEEVARVGRERGEKEFERRAELERQKHAEAVARAQAERGDSPTPTTARAGGVLSGRLVVAISSSMPEEMVREYMRQLDQVPEAIVVLRGFVGGAKKVAPTGAWIEQVRRKQPSCRECAHYMVEVVVDPLAYSMLGIEKVPAVTFLPGVQDLKHCDSDVLQATSVAYGATSIQAALKAVKAKGVAVPDELVRRWAGRS